MNKEDLINTVGGIKWNATLFNALTRIIDTVYNIGRRFGSGLLRNYVGKTCSPN